MKNLAAIFYFVFHTQFNYEKKEEKHDMKKEKYAWRYADTKEPVVEKQDCFLLIPEIFQDIYGFGIYEKNCIEDGKIGTCNVFEMILKWNINAIPKIAEEFCKHKHHPFSKEQLGELLLFYYGIDTKSSLVELGKCLAHYNTMLPYPIKIATKPAAYEKIAASEFVEVTEQESAKEKFLYGAYICFPDAEEKAVFKYEEIPISEYDPYGLFVSGQYAISNICSTDHFTATYLDTKLQIGQNSHAFYSESEDACVDWLKSEHARLLEEYRLGYESLKNVIIEKKQ